MCLEPTCPINPSEPFMPVLSLSVSLEDILEAAEEAQNAEASE